MKDQQFFDILSAEVIKSCVSDYNSRGKYETTDMNKTKPGQSLYTLIPYIESCLQKKLKFTFGNFYKHSYPYLPHTDFRISQSNYINVVIPLNYTDSLPYLIVFDQTWSKNSVTWCMQHTLLDFKLNTGVLGAPCQYDVGNLTNQDIDFKFYSKYLDHYPKELLRGLSGTAYPFEPGSIICFDSRKIHCTSKFTGNKLGISLRFKDAI